MSQVLLEQSGDDWVTAMLGLEDMIHNVNQVDAQSLWASFLGSLDKFDEHLEDESLLPLNGKFLAHNSREQVYSHRPERMLDVTVFLQPVCLKLKDVIVNPN